MRKTLPLALVCLAFVAVSCKKEETMQDKINAAQEKTKEGVDKAADALKDATK